MVRSCFRSLLFRNHHHSKLLRHLPEIPTRSAPPLPDSLPLLSSSAHLRRPSAGAMAVPPLFLPLPTPHPHSQSRTKQQQQEDYNEEGEEEEEEEEEVAIDFTKIDRSLLSLLPTAIIVGRPNVGKSALFNLLIRRREALVYNIPDDHVTRDIREGIAKLGDLRFRILDSAGLETEAASGTILSRTTAVTGNVLARSQFAIFLIDVR